MSERPSRITDTDRIREGVQQWREFQDSSVISDTLARIIASQWHGGQRSPMYSFASTGRIDLAEIVVEITENACNTHDVDELDALEALAEYVVAFGDREAIEGWHEATRWDVPDEHYEQIEATAVERQEVHDMTQRVSAHTQERLAAAALERQHINFRDLTTEQLIARLERSEPFKSDDEEVELNRRLRLEGKTWMWDDIHVRVITLEEAERLEAERRQR